MFIWRQRVGEHHWMAFTDVEAGNLALHVGDSPVAVGANRDRLQSRMPVEAGSLRFMNQVHSATAAPAPLDPADAPTADAMVSADGAASLAVMVADCVPVLLIGSARSSPSGVVTAAAHAGRAGLAAGVLVSTVAMMRRDGASSIRAWFGPSICGSCYEVPEDLRDQVGETVPQTPSRTRWGTAGLDLRRGAAAQLRELDVQAESVGPCTYESGRLFSYRRDASTGRFAGVVYGDGPG